MRPGTNHTGPAFAMVYDHSRTVTAMLASGDYTEDGGWTVQGHQRFKARMEQARRCDNGIQFLDSLDHPPFKRRDCRLCGKVLWHLWSGRQPTDVCNKCFWIDTDMWQEGVR